MASLTAGLAAVVGAGVFGLVGGDRAGRCGSAATLLNPGLLPHPVAGSTDVSKMVRADYGADESVNQ